MNLKPAMSVAQLRRKKFKPFEFEGVYAETIGQFADSSGSWIIYGPSGNGKTSLAFALARYFTRFGRVAYNTIEEGARLSFQNALNRQEFSDKEMAKFSILSESMEELGFRLKLQKAPDIIIIDSLQYTFLTKREYKALVDKYKTKLFIWISHADGKKPEGKLARDVEYHADVKIRVEGFKAIIKTRFEGTGDITINEERAAEYWNLIE